MLSVKTLLNHVHPVKGFVYESARLSGDRKGRDVQIEVDVRPRRGSRGICSGCGKRASGYDRLEERGFQFVPLWGIAVVLFYSMRRVNCVRCGVTVESVPWSDGKGLMTHALKHFLATWARRLSWREASRVFGVSWESIYRSVRSIVEYGLEHRDLSGITAIGIDEIAYRKRHRYLTVVYQINQGVKRLLHVAEDRTEASLESFVEMLGETRTASIEFVCSDMWRPYLNVIRSKMSGAVHILDRYHIVANLNKAIDKVRATESKRLKAEGYEAHLKGMRWCFLKRRAKLSKKQKLRLRDVLMYDLRTVRAYLLKEAFQAFWEYESPTWAGKFLDAWCSQVMRSRIEPMKAVARSLRSHRELILNWFRARKEFNSGVVEGLNASAKLGFRKARGFKQPEVAAIALYHQLGELPEPESTHRFC